jgi:hypothetical protein
MNFEKPVKNHRGVDESRIKIYLNEKGRGSSLDDSILEELPTEFVLVDSLTCYEPEEKMDKVESQAILNKIVKEIEFGGVDKIPPILVMETRGGYMIIDGHHRYHAHKTLGLKFIKAKVAPQEEIQVSLS